MKKHTKGPWKYGGCITGPNNELICQMHDEENVCADAALISAAPDLLDACKEIQGMFERGEIVRDVTRDGDPDWITKMLDFVPRLNKLMAAIAKAEGK